MSLMAMSASQSSMFTFESTVHCSHVLRSLDEQRRQDALCDVTVAAEGQSFRAHRSVLASCSDYFAHRISTLAQHGAVITLPQEVRRHLTCCPRAQEISSGCGVVGVKVTTGRFAATPSADLFHFISSFELPVI